MTAGSDSVSFLLPVMSQKDVSFVAQLGARLEHRGHDVTYIPQNERLTVRDATQHPLLEGVVLDHINSSPATPFYDLLDRYEIDCPRALVFPQMVYDYQYTNVAHRPFLLGAKSVEYEPYFDILHRALDTLDRIYDDGDGPIPLQHQGAEILRRALQRVADTHGIESVWVGNSPLDGHCGLHDDELVNWATFADDYEPTMSTEDRERGRRFIEDVREQQPLTGLSWDESGFDSVSKIEQTVGRVRRLASPNHDTSAMIKGWLRYNGRKVGKRIRGKLAQRVYLDEERSRRVVDQQRYVFFPIQYVRESRVTVRSPPFYDLAWFVEYLSRSLPLGYELVVKDHPNHVGILPFDTLRTIGRFAEFVHPDLNAHHVVRNADAVVTLNNTVGYEALIHGKPVVVMGEAFYDGAGYVWKPDSIKSLPETLSAAVESKGLTEEEILTFVHRIIEGSYPGDWNDLTDENVDQLVDSILNYTLERLQSESAASNGTN